VLGHALGVGLQVGTSPVRPPPPSLCVCGAVVAWAAPSLGAAPPDHSCMQAVPGRRRPPCPPQLAGPAHLHALTVECGAAVHACEGVAAAALEVLGQLGLRVPDRRGGSQHEHDSARRDASRRQGGAAGGAGDAQACHPAVCGLRPRPRPRVPRWQPPPVSPVGRGRGWAQRRQGTLLTFLMLSEHRSQLNQGMIPRWRGQSEKQDTR
jgi:hypothetical protein